MAGGASAYSDQDEDRLITDINVTPLVDIVLVLLIVFMITMPTIVKLDAMQEGELDISLPQASEAQPLTAKTTKLTLNIDANGQYIVGRVVHSEADLGRLLQDAQAHTPGRTTLLIRADKRCQVQFVTTAIDLCHKAKITDYWLSTVQQ